MFITMVTTFRWNAVYLHQSCDTPYKWSFLVGTNDPNVVDFPTLTVPKSQFRENSWVVCNKFEITGRAPKRYEKLVTRHGQRLDLWIIYLLIYRATEIHAG